jgi:hypothetical protein
MFLGPFEKNNQVSGLFASLLTIAVLRFESNLDIGGVDRDLSGLPVCRYFLRLRNVQDRASVRIELNQQISFLRHCHCEFTGRYEIVEGASDLVAFYRSISFLSAGQMPMNVDGLIDQDSRHFYSFPESV